MVHVDVGTFSKNGLMYTDKMFKRYFNVSGVTKMDDACAGVSYSTMMSRRF